MGKVIVGMTISLDGFVNDRTGSVERLYPEIEKLRDTEVLQQIMRSTGAVVMGRRSYEMAQGDFTGYEFQTPIFVVTHNVPTQVTKGENENLKFHFVTSGVESAVAQAKAAAGDKNVTVIGGPNIVQQMIQAGLCDEIEVDIAPVLFGEGQRLFEKFDHAAIDLEPLQVLEYRGVTQIRYRVVK